MLKSLAAVSIGCFITASATAQSAPVVGLVEVLPITENVTLKVLARPTYIFTNTALSAPTVFSALSADRQSSDVLCCFEVKDIKPLDLRTEIARYPGDAEFGEHMRGIKGYAHFYRAQPVAKERWNVRMKQSMGSSPSDETGTPYSYPVIAAMINDAEVPATFNAGGTSITLRPQYNNKQGRDVYTFTVGSKRIVMSEDHFPHD